MGCNSEYLAETSREKGLKLIANLYRHVLKQLNLKIPKQVHRAADAQYCDTDYVAELCGLLNSLPPAVRDTIIYNARDPWARQLATWWEEHVQADAIRISKGKAEKSLANIRAKALKKLSSVERKALGL